LKTTEAVRQQQKWSVDVALNGGERQGGQPKKILSFPLFFDNGVRFSDTARTTIPLINLIDLID
jgi:hypothetical protein